jgi:adhesin/invasin
MASKLPIARFALMFAALASACGGDNLTLPDQGEPAEVEILGGNQQNGTIGEALADSLVVEVRDGFRNPVAGVTVTWSAEGGGSVDPVESLTGPDGRAGTVRVLGPQPSTYFTFATVAGLPAAVRFTSTGFAARLVITSVIPAIAVSGVPLSPQPTLQLQGADGSAIAREGVIVTAQIASGDGSLEGATEATSDADGRVAFTDLAITGSPGARRLRFFVDEVDDGFAPATTTPIALGVGVPASIELAAGDDQTATAGQAVPIAPAVLVRDADGNPLDGIPVTFTPAAGGGSVTGNPSLTDGNGVAAVGEWELGTSVGENTLSAAVAGQDLIGSPVVFSATALPGGVSAEQSTVVAAPASISASSGSSASTITVTVRDPFGNPVQGVEVTLVATGTGNALVQPTAVTNAAGVATGKLSATTLGSREVSAAAGGTAIAGTATVTVVAGAPTAGTSSASVPGGTSGVLTTFSIQLKDAFGNPVAGAAPSIAVAISGPNAGAGVRVSDEGAGQYRATYTPRASGNDLVDVRVSGAPIPGSPFTSAVVPGPVSPSASTAVVTHSGGIFGTIGAVVTARDAQGNPVGRGGDKVLVTVNTGNPVTATDQGNGTYEASISTFGFSFSVAITLNGTAIQGSPFRVP